ncbi:hypothetical protein JOB18_031538 [Solea senegalensis]|uniref:Uncharacterized protein n=1 Tax=Solea senegalensis TaxID=28829 RepID=A0AAV6SMR0_SOLSE|nr:hypothetical protein JOB18_031538 [Solea senegalensis]
MSCYKDQTEFKFIKLACIHANLGDQTMKKAGLKQASPGSGIVMVIAKAMLPAKWVVHVFVPHHGARQKRSSTGPRDHWSAKRHAVSSRGHVDPDERFFHAVRGSCKTKAKEEEFQLAPFPLRLRLDGGAASGNFTSCKDKTEGEGGGGGEWSAAGKHYQYQLSSLEKK